MKKKREQEFLRHLTKLPVIEFYGVLKILQVPLPDSKNTGDVAGDLLNQALVKFCVLSRRQQKTLLMLLRAANEDRSSSQDFSVSQKPYIDEGAPTTQSDTQGDNDEFK